MDLFQAFLLGALQGVTEFLPISSSGHLVLGEHFLGLNVESLKTFDVAVHVGTLLAIFVYFRVEILNLIKALGKLCCGKKDKDVMMLNYIIIGTIPAVFAGLFLEDFIDGLFRNITAVATWMMIVAIFFVLGERFFRIHGSSKFTWPKALIIGLAQMVALVPGVSRSGSTIVAGLFVGMKREEAARFSFLLGSPAIFGAGLLKGLEVFKSGVHIDFAPMAVGFISAFIFGMVSVWGLMKFLKNHSLIVFAAYLAAIGSFVLFL
ncbi:undecaprenyl-diphosphatase UppP [Candidatus Peregrinibacteria bacterium CG10_big_fil_rev_8_21_14_0_10_36_19]|nr:MAG: undecaprenyl-diphosphatase UppP [Candidatus Peregrinibacteria bacterium CG10_big_fil_rev_8_21_14_0_10_36_19]